MPGDRRNQPSKKNSEKELLLDSVGGPSAQSMESVVQNDQVSLNDGSVTSDQNNQTSHPALTQAYLTATRFLAREPLLRRLLLSRQVSLKGASVPVEVDQLPAVARADYFASGVNTFFEFLWPATFYSLLIHDLAVYYAEPNLRYGNTLGDIFAGTSPNTLTLTSHFGSDLPTEAAYWISAGILLGAPLALGLFNLLRVPDFKPALADSFQFKKAFERMSNKHGALACLNPLSSFNTEVNHAEFLLLWDKRMHEDDRRKYLFESLKTSLNMAKGLQRFRLLKILANVADGDDDRGIARYDGGSVAAPDEFIHIKSQALDQLNQLTNFSSESFNNYRLSYPLTWLYANYLRWNLGQLPKAAMRKMVLDAFVFWPTYFLGAYSSIRWLEFLIQRFLGLGKYLQQKNACESTDKIYEYINRMAEYTCRLCSDWNVYYPDTDDSQACLDQFLLQPKSPQAVINALQRVFAYPNFTRIDFSQQDWLNWSLEQLDQVFSFIEQAAMQHPEFMLKEIILSGRLGAGITLNQDKIDRIVAFLNHFQLTSFDISHLGLSDDLLARLLAGLNQQHQLLALVLSGNYIDIQASNALTAILSSNPLESLDLSFTQAEDAVLEKIVASFPATLRRFVCQNNAVGQVTLNALADNLHINTLVLSGNNMANVNFTTFAELLFQTNLTMIDFSETDLTEKQSFLLFNGLRGSAVKILEIGFNTFLPGTLPRLIESTQGSQLERLGGSATDLGNDDFVAIMQLQPKTPVRAMDVSRNQLNFFAINNPLIFNHTLQELNLSYNRLETLSGAGLMRLISNQHLQKFFINGIGIDASMANDLLRAIGDNPNLITISYADNALGDDFFVGLVNVSRTQLLTTLIASDNQLTQNAVQAAARMLPSSYLKYIDVSRNPAIGPAGSIAIAEQLTDVPNPKELEKSQPSVDFRRALTKANPRTRLTFFAADHMGAEEPGVAALCDVAPSARWHFDAFNLNNNSAPYDGRTCVPLSVAGISGFFPRHARAIEPSETFSLSSNQRLLLGAAIPMAGTILLAVLFFTLLYRWKYPEQEEQAQQELNEHGEERRMNLP